MAACAIRRFETFLAQCRDLPLPVRGPTACARFRRASVRSMSSSEAPFRIASRKSISSFRSRQRRSLPSAVNRTRLQNWQNGWDTGEMNPIVPSRAGKLPEPGGIGWIRIDRSKRAVVSFEARFGLFGRDEALVVDRAHAFHRHDLEETDFPRLVDAERGHIDNFVLVLASHDDGIEFDRADADALGFFDAGKHEIEPATTSHELERERIERVDADVDAIESGVFQIGRHAGRSRPLVVIEISSTPGNVFISRMRSSTCGRIVGSPPVSRSLVKPDCAKRPTRRISSSSVSSSSRG